MLSLRRWCFLTLIFSSQDRDDLYSNRIVYDDKCLIPPTATTITTITPSTTTTRSEDDDDDDDDNLKRKQIVQCRRFYYGDTVRGYPIKPLPLSTLPICVREPIVFKLLVEKATNWHEFALLLDITQPADANDAEKELWRALCLPSLEQIHKNTPEIAADKRLTLLNIPVTKGVRFDVLMTTPRALVYNTTLHPRILWVFFYTGRRIRFKLPIRVIQLNVIFSRDGRYLFASSSTQQVDVMTNKRRRLQRLGRVEENVRTYVYVDLVREVLLNDEPYPLSYSLKSVNYMILERYYTLYKFSESDETLRRHHYPPPECSALTVSLAVDACCLSRKLLAILGWLKKKK